MPQIIGSVVIPAWAFVTMFGLCYALKMIGFLRVSMEEEIEGLDLTEHGTVNYPEFGSSVVNTQSVDSPALPAR
jgi:Amt family ammonium transporter